jgi:hypothetical protein
MSALFRVSIVGASLTSAIALSDAVYHGFTGRNVGPASEPAATWVTVAGSLIHGFTYAALAAVLITASARVDRGSPIRSGLRWLLAGCFGVMAAVFTLGSPVLATAGDDPPAVLGVPAAGAFVGMFLLSVALGVATIRLPALRPSSVLLILVAPTLLVITGLGALDSDFAHPGYAEALVNFGVALLGFHRAAISGQPSQVTAGESPVGAGLDQHT